MVRIKKQAAKTAKTHVTRSRARSSVYSTAHQPVTGPSENLSEDVIADSESANKRRKVTEVDRVNARAATLHTASIDASRKITRKAIAGLAAVEPSRAPPTPRRRTTRFSKSKSTFSDEGEQEEEEKSEEEKDEKELEVVDENEVESEDGESEAEEFQPSPDDSDEYAEEDEEFLVSRNARAAVPGPSSARAGPAVDNNDDSEQSDSSNNIPQIQHRSESNNINDITAVVIPQRIRGRRGMSITRGRRQILELYKWHPELGTVWEDLNKRRKVEVLQDPQPQGLTLTMLPFQLEGLYWMRNQEETAFHGGILADEMGMGKTIQTIALLMAEPRQKPNLVVAPTVALLQWRNEIEKHTANALSVTVFHGANRSGDIKTLKQCDVIMTTYSVLESMFRKQQHGFKRKGGLVKENSILHKIQFHRVILDEAHNIKDRSCSTAKAVFSLKTKYKLCLTGTPLQNRIGEFFSLLRFLEVDPFSYYFCRKCPCKSLHWKFSDNRTCDKCQHRPMDHCCWFNTELLKPIQKYGNIGEGKAAFEKLRQILSHIMLRRTKVERADDLGLPPRIVRIRRDYFNEEELDLYDSIYGESRRKFDTYVAQGVVLNNYANIFTLLTRMRQLADHPDLVLRRHAENGQNTLVCCICDDEAEEAIASKCHHKFCRMCVSKYIESYDGAGAPDCPQCHVPLSIDLTQPAMEDFSNVGKGSIINRIGMNDWKSSTKIEALVEELYKLRSKTHTIKSIVFSQFTSMLQLVEWRLHRGGFKTVMLEGSMSPSQRNAVIEHFMENTSVEVFLVSLKAGGVALNLTEASHVFILDPWWNPSAEWQSGDRVHRIGQKRSCTITKLVIEDSIESRIIELQEKKARMIEATVNGDAKSMEKLTPADMQFLFQN